MKKEEEWDKPAAAEEWNKGIWQAGLRRFSEGEARGGR